MAQSAKKSFELIAIGMSAGGLAAFKELMKRVSNPNGIPIVVIQHIKPILKSALPEIITQYTGVKCLEAEDKMPVNYFTIYTSAPNYHLLLEKDKTLTLSTEEKVCYSRPSIDVFFTSAADVYGDKMIGIILSGANDDGAKGLGEVIKHKGYSIVQNPQTAFASRMPKSAIELNDVDFVGKMFEISGKLNELLEN